MSIHTSIKVSRKQAAAIVAAAMTRDEDLKELASYIMAKYTFNNVYALDDRDNEDIEATSDYGASFELSELLLIGGGIGPDFKVGAARSS